MKRSRGARRDSSMATQRRLQLVRHLMRGPATAADLVTALKQHFGEDIYLVDAHAALRHDIKAVREIFACKIVYQPDQGYVLVSLGHLALLDLPAEEREDLVAMLSALGALLAARRAGHDAESADRLIARLRMLLPEEQRQQ